MRRFLGIFLALMLVCAGATAESVFVQGGGGAAALGQHFMRVAESEGDALVRIDPVGEPHISMRAEALGDMLEMDGVLYYLLREGDVWRLMALDSDTAYVAYEFPAGKRVSDIGMRDGVIFVLVDDMLHVLYIRQGLCLQLAGANMEDIAIQDDYAYFIAHNDRVEHSLAGTDGSVVQKSVGKLCRMDMSTGSTIVIAPEGAADLKYHAGKLYFHSYADIYLMGSGADASLEGYLACYDIATGRITALTEAYDWDFVVTSAGVCVLRQDGLVALPGDRVRYELPETALIEAAGDAIIVFDPHEMTFTVLH